MRKLITIILILFCGSSFGQVYQLMPQYGYQANRMVFDSTLQIPTTCGVPTLKSVQFTTRRAAIAFDSCNNRFYQYNPKTTTWSVVSGGGGGSTDTTSLSNRINLKIDSVKRRLDSVFAYRNGTEVYQFKDSIGSDTASVVIAKVHNATGTTLQRGEVVYLSGSNGDVASVKRANNKQDSTSSKTFGIVRRNIAAGDTGYITTQGQIEKLNLGSYTAGDIIWLDSIDGQFTKVKPTAPYHQVFLGVVERANNGNGLAYVKPQNGYELGELHNVSVNSERNNSIFYYDSTNRLWKAKDIDSFSAPTLQRVLTRSSLVTSNNVITGQTNTTIKQTGSSTKVAQLIIDTLQTSLGNTGTSNTSSILSLETNSAQLQTTQTLSAGALVTIPTASYLRFTKVSPSLNYNFGVSEQGAYWANGGSTYYLPLTSGTTGQVLKLSSSSQLAWQNDSVGITDTTSLSNRINTKLNSSDTASLSNRINTKLNITDTSVFDRKQLAAYSFMANGTSAAANSVATYFKDTSGTYTGSPTWNGTAPTSGNLSYRWTRIGKMVNLHIALVYSVAGTTNSTLTIPLPSDCPNPVDPAGLSSNLSFMYNVQLKIFAATNALASVTERAGLRKNSGGTGYEINAAFSGTAVISAIATLTYWTN